MTCVHQSSDIQHYWNNHIKTVEYELKGKQVICFVKKNQCIYVLYEYPTKGIKTIDVIVLLSKRDGFGYRIYNEQTHPFYYLCKKSFLDASTNMHPRAIEWRKECIEKARHGLVKKKIKSFISEILRAGMVIQTWKHGKVEFIEYTEGKKGFIGYDLEADTQRTYPFRIFQLEELEEFINFALQENKKTA
jgi:hypothetical protein